MDDIDRRILKILQEEAGLPVAEIADKVGLSPSPCWRRIQKLEAEGVIERRVALLNPEKMNVGVTVFVAIRTSQHDRSEEHTSELQSLMRISYAVFCLKKKKRNRLQNTPNLSTLK